MERSEDNGTFSGRYEQLQTWLKKNEERNNKKVAACREYLAALDQWNKEDSALRTKAGGEVPPLITAPKRDKLLELHKKIAEKTDAFLKIAKDDSELTELVRGLSRMTADNFTRLLRYDPKEPKTMEGIEESTQKLRLDISNTPTSKTVKGNSSSRKIISYKDNRGRVVNGIFTEKTLLTPLADLEKGLKDIAEKIENKEPTVFLFDDFATKEDETAAIAKEKEQAKESQRKVAAFIRTLVDEVVKYQKRTRGSEKHLDNDERSRAAAKLAYCIAELDENYQTTQRQPQSGEIAEALVGFLNQLGENRYTPNQLVSIMGGQVLWDICRLFAKTYKPLHYRINEFGGGYPEGVRKDSLNTAMSSVADLLGVPSLLARSEPARLTLKNGSMLEGTFMHAAKGVDLQHPTQDTPPIPTAFLEGKATEKSSEFLRKLADLQVLDYICGNWDRHWGNLIYRFDKDGNPVDVQGIDNDECFGMLDPGDKNTPLPHPEEMVAISQSMANKVMKLTPETLRYFLRAQGLHERLIESAVKRLEHTKQVIAWSIQSYKGFDATRKDAKNNPYHIPVEAKGKCVRIIPDKDFSKISIKDLCHTIPYIPGQKSVFDRKNIFQWAVDGLEQMKPGTEEWKLQANSVTGADNRTDAAALRAWLGELKALDRALTENVPSDIASPSHNKNWFGDWLDRFFASSPSASSPSQCYQKMQESLQNLRKNHEALLERLEKPSDARQAVVTVKDLSELTVQYQELEKLTREYLRSVEGATEPEVKARVKVAKEVLKLAKKGGRERIDEWVAVERNTLRALEEFDRTRGNQAQNTAEKTLREPPRQPSELPQKAGQTKVKDLQTKKEALESTQKVKVQEIPKKKAAKRPEKIAVKPPQSPRNADEKAVLLRRGDNAPKTKHAGKRKYVHIFLDKPSKTKGPLTAFYLNKPGNARNRPGEMR